MHAAAAPRLLALRLILALSCAVPVAPGTARAVNMLPLARPGIALFAVSYARQDAGAATYAPRYQVMTSNWNGNVQPMHDANPLLPLLGYVDPCLQFYEPWYPEAQRIETVFHHTGDPASLTALPSPGAIRLAWLPDGRTALGFVDVAGYNVYRRDAPDGALSLLTPTPTTATGFEDTGLTDGASYEYTVTTVDRALGELAYSSVVSATPGPAGAALTPVSVSMTYGSGTTTIAISVAASPAVSGVNLVLDRSRNRQFESTEYTAMTRGGTDAFGFHLYSATVTLRETSADWGVNGCSWYAQSAPDTSVRLPATAYFSTNPNNRIRGRVYGPWIVNPADSSWQRILTNGARSLVALGYDGIFFDGGVINIYNWLLDAIPTADAVAGWQEGTRSLIAAIKTAVSPGAVIFNGLDRGDLTYLDTADGGMTEGFAAQPWFGEGALTDWAWFDYLDTALLAATNTPNAVQLNYAIGPDSSTAIRMYALASHLLVANEHSFFAYSGCSCPTYFPEWDLPIGQPLESFSQIAEAHRPSGLYGRAYSEGLVLVNSSATLTHTEVLDRVYARAVPHGGMVPEYGGNGTVSPIWVQTLTLRPHEAAILLNSWGDMTPPDAPPPSIPGDGSGGLSLFVYPNPAATHLTLALDQATEGQVTVAVYDVGGRRVATLLDESMPVGSSLHPIDLTAVALRPGVYTAVARTGSARQTRLLVVAR